MRRLAHALLVLLILPALVTGQVTVTTTGGVDLTATNAWTGSNSFIDGSFSIIGSSDATKVAKFEVDGFTTANTRIFTLPGTTGNDTIATAAGLNVFTNTNGNTFNNDVPILLGTTGLGIIDYGTAQTPDAVLLGTPAASNSFSVVERADVNFDFNNGPCGTAACVDPTLTVHSHTQDITQYNANAAWGRAGKMVKTLTETTNTSAFQFSVASDAGAGGVVDFTVFASDGTIQQTLTGMLQYSAVAEGTTVTCPTPTVAGTALNAVTAGTLTCTYNCLTGTNTAAVQFNCTSSATQTTLDLYYQVNHVGPGSITPQ